MFLKRFVFVNWGNIPNLEFDFGPVNLLSGGNGSGKTTAADALQTVMTAAHENLFQYNPGQDETTQRGRGGKRVRTLASYALGCDDGSYARTEPCDAYLAAIFHPTKGENASAFTVLIGIRAWLDQSGGQMVARQEDLQFYLLADQQLELGDLVKGTGDDRQVQHLDQLHNHLIKQFGKRSIEKYETKKAYLRRLFGALKGRRDAVTEQEAVAAARAFSRFMAYKPVSSINAFVRDEILERRDLGEAVRSVSSQLKTIHGMEREANQLQESIDILDNARIQSQIYIDQWIELNVLDYLIYQHEFLTRQDEFLTARRTRKTLLGSISETDGEIIRSRQLRDNIHSQLVSLEAKRLGITELQQKDELEAELTKADQQLIDRSQNLLSQDQKLQQNLTLSRQISNRVADAELVDQFPELATLETRTLLKELLDNARSNHIELHDLLQRDVTGDLGALEQQLDKARLAQTQHNNWVAHWHDESLLPTGSMVRRLGKIEHEQETRYERLTQHRQQKTQEVERLENKRVNYPSYVERAISAIRHQCPGADPRVLCDHVEVKDERWQSAIEGYLGGARFSIIVEHDHEAEAIRVVRSLTGRDNRARIIQGYKAGRDAERIKLDTDSIMHVLEFSHSVARDYVMASYGTVLRVDSAEELRNTRRGITVEGLASGNYSMWRSDISDAELVFGATARQRALQAKLQEQERLDIEWTKANDSMQLITGLRKCVDGLAALEYAEVFNAMLMTHREIIRLNNQIKNLDLSEFQALESELESLRKEETDLDEKFQGMNRDVGDFNRQLDDIESLCKSLSQKQESTIKEVEKAEEALQTLSGAWPDFDADRRLENADSEARDLSPETADIQREELLKDLNSREREMSEAVRQHNQRCRPGDAIVYMGFNGSYDGQLFATICSLQGEIDRVFNILKNNVLLDKRQQLEQLKLSFNNAFVSHLCHAIHQAIQDGDRQITQLNRELTQHHFGSDLETFRFDSSWIPEFQNYARFFKEVATNPVLGEQNTLFDADLSKRNHRVRDELMALLLNEDEQRAFQELARMADYRNYKQYEIYKEVAGKPAIALSEYGTGSGGQLETPAYIIRSAAITSAFRFSEGSSHLRMVLVDEAFSKMDEVRSREVISYLTESLGLQLIFIMPTSKCGPYMDLISNEFVFAKCPSNEPRGQLNTRVLVDRKACNQEKITELWSNHRRTVHQQAELDFMAEFADS